MDTDTYREDFLDGMSRAATSVSIVTTKGPDGPAGVTVSAMCSVSAEPPTLLVCIHHLSPAAAAIENNGTFCVNLLNESQAGISDTFAGRSDAPGGDKFGCAHWYPMATGSPALSGGLAAFDCTVVKSFRWLSHHVFIGEVVDVELQDGRPLIYSNRSYGTTLLEMEGAMAVS